MTMCSTHWCRALTHPACLPAVTVPCKWATPCHSKSRRARDSPPWCSPAAGSTPCCNDTAVHDCPHPREDEGGLAAAVDDHVGRHRRQERHPAARAAQRLPASIHVACCIITYLGKECKSGAAWSQPSVVHPFMIGNTFATQIFEDSRPGKSERTKEQQPQEGLTTLSPGCLCAPSSLGCVCAH